MNENAKAPTEKTKATLAEACLNFHDLMANADTSVVLTCQAENTKTYGEITITYAGYLRQTCDPLLPIARQAALDAAAAAAAAPSTDVKKDGAQ